MKAKDLMVGDWVIARILHDSCPRENIRQISYGEFEWEDTQQYPLVEFDPIPLTPEILEKNGFADSYINKNLDKDKKYRWSDVYGNCVVVDLVECKIKIQHDTRIVMDLWYNEIVPVHELQHALKQGGIKKEIKI